MLIPIKVKIFHIELQVKQFLQALLDIYLIHKYFSNFTLLKKYNQKYIINYLNFIIKYDN